MSPRKIVLAKFPFTDLSSSKRRPVLVLAQSKSNANDFVVSFISSVIPDALSEVDHLLEITDEGFASTGLSRNSIFRMDKIATLDQSVFTGELGEIGSGLFEELKKKLRIALDLQ